jgi:hypothetical protein
VNFLRFGLPLVLLLVFQEKTVSGYQYKGGQFYKNGKVLDKGDDIADALSELSQDDYFGGPTIEGAVPKVANERKAGARR